VSGTARGAVVVPPGGGFRLGNVEFLAHTRDTPRFTLALITIAPHAGGPGTHSHAEEDDSFFMLEGELVFTVEGEQIHAPAGTFVLVPPGVEHDFRNDGDEPARFVNVHAPAGFDLRLAAD
jgi:mannose-6-phosphate isomerase-like protein (cupin superfamily)